MCLTSSFTYFQLLISDSDWATSLRTSSRPRWAGRWLPRSSRAPWRGSTPSSKRPFPSTWNGCFAAVSAAAVRSAALSGPSFASASGWVSPDVIIRLFSPCFFRCIVTSHEIETFLFDSWKLQKTLAVTQSKVYGSFLYWWLTKRDCFEPTDWSKR